MLKECACKILMDTFINHSNESIYYSQNDFRLRGHSFSTYAKFSEKLTLLTR